MTMRVISVTNLKGGSAKSTTAFNLAGALTELNYKVLAIDLDPQQTLSLSYLGVGQPSVPLSTALMEDISLENTIVRTSYANLFAVPADHKLKAIKDGQVQIDGGELRLRTCLRKPSPSQGNNNVVLSEFFDWVIIDCPPSLDRLTMNALVAADLVLVPVDPGAGGRTALADTVKYVAAAQKWYNPTLRIVGLLINNINTNTVYDQTTERAVRDIYKEKVFKAVIPSSVRIREATELRTPTVYCEGSEYRRYAEVYRQFCQEFLFRAGVNGGKA